MVTDYFFPFFLHPFSHWFHCWSMFILSSFYTLSFLILFTATQNLWLTIEFYRNFQLLCDFRVNSNPWIESFCNGILKYLIVSSKMIISPSSQLVFGALFDIYAWVINWIEAKASKKKKNTKENTRETECRMKTKNYSRKSIVWNKKIMAW